MPSFRRRTRQHAASPLLAPPHRRAPLDVEQLRRFVAVASTGGFTAAAHALRIAQPAVSRSVRALEEELGERLIERTTRRFALTSLGQRVLAECVPLFERIEALRELATVEEMNLAGALRIGAAEPIAAALLPRALALLGTRHPNLHPYVVVAPTRDLVARLTASDLEVVLTFNPLRGGAFVRRTLATYRFHVLVSADRARDPRTCETFFGSREVEDERERAFPALQAWRRRWPATRIRASTNSLAAQVELVRAGAGVAVLPEFLVHEDLASGRLVGDVDMPELVFPLIAVRRPPPPSPGALALLAALDAGPLLVPGVVATRGGDRRRTPSS